MNLEQQVLVFAVNLAVGVLFGVIYDLYRVIDRRFRFSPGFTQAGDLLIWIALGASIFAILQSVNRGEFRLFVLLGLGLGVLFYRQCFRRRVAWGLLRLVDTAARAVGAAGLLLLRIYRPFRTVFRLMVIPLKGAGRFFNRMFGALKLLTRKIFFLKISSD